MDHPSSSSSGGVLVSPFSTLFKNSWELYKKAWKLFLALIGLYILVMIVFGAIGLLVGESQAIGFLMLLGVFILFVGFLWLITSTYVLIAKRATGAEARLLPVLQEGGKKILGFLWIGILLQLVLLGGMLLFIVPAVIWFVWFGFAPYIYVTENIRGVAALKRSKALVKGLSWTVLFRYVLGWVVFFALGLVAIIPIVGWIAYAVVLLPLSLIYPYFLYRSVAEIKQASPTAKESVPAWKKVVVVLVLGAGGALYIAFQMMLALFGQTGNLSSSEFDSRFDYGSFDSGDFELPSDVFDYTPTPDDGFGGGAGDLFPSEIPDVDVQ